MNLSQIFVGLNSLGTKMCVCYSVYVQNVLNYKKRKDEIFKEMLS